VLSLLQGKLAAVRRQQSEGKTQNSAVRMQRTYLAFAAMLCAGIDGIKNEIDPGEPLDVDIYELSPEELAKVPSTPGSLMDALKRARSRILNVHWVSQKTSLLTYVQN